jgi:hypothetical protein
MDMSKYNGEQFLKPDDVRDGPLVMQIAAVKLGKFDRPEIVFESGAILTINVGNNNILTRAYGPDSNDWLGKEIELTLGQVKYKGELQDSVVVRPVSPPLAAGELTAATNKMAAAATDEMNDEIPF